MTCMKGVYGDGGRYIDGRIEKMREGERGKWGGYHEERERNKGKQI